jgi:hypothetical protein
MMRTFKSGMVPFTQKQSKAEKDALAQLRAAWDSYKNALDGINAPSKPAKPVRARVKKGQTVLEYDGGTKHLVDKETGKIVVLPKCVSQFRPKKNNRRPVVTEDEKREDWSAGNK